MKRKLQETEQVLMNLVFSRFTPNHKIRFKHAAGTRSSGGWLSSATRPETQPLAVCFCLFSQQGNSFLIYCSYFVVKNVPRWWTETKKQNKSNIFIFTQEGPSTGKTDLYPCAACHSSTRAYRFRQSSFPGGTVKVTVIHRQMYPDTPHTGKVLPDTRPQRHDFSEVRYDSQHTG